MAQRLYLVLYTIRANSAARFSHVATIAVLPVYVCKQVTRTLKQLIFTLSKSNYKDNGPVMHMVYIVTVIIILL